MTRLLLIVFITLLCLDKTIGQIPPDSIYNGWIANKEGSIFQQVAHGKFFGTTTGYIQVANGKDTLLLDFRASKTTLSLINGQEEPYQNNEAIYSILTTNGKEVCAYVACSIANSFNIVLNGEHYCISTIYGVCDTPILGLTVNYCHKGSTEYLTLFVEKPLQLITIKFDNLDTLEVRKTITVLSGSTLILTIKK